MVLLRLLWGIVAYPVTTLDAFHLREKRLRLRYGFMAYVAGGVLWACLELPRAVSTNSPYPWALPFLAVLFSLPWIMPASWFHLFAKAFRGKGDLEATLAYLGLPSFVLMTTLGVVDTLNLYVLPHSFPGVGLSKTDIYRTLSILVGAWPLVLSVLALQRAHAVSLLKAIAIAVSAVVTGTPLVLFIYYL
jgi:hypothetical protein